MLNGLFHVRYADVHYTSIFASLLKRYYPDKTAVPAHNHHWARHWLTVFTGTWITQIIERQFSLSGFANKTRPLVFHSRIDLSSQNGWSSPMVPGQAPVSITSHRSGVYIYADIFILLICIVNPAALRPMAANRLTANEARISCE